MKNKYLKLDGEWISSGSEKKILHCDNTPTISRWNEKKLLHFEDANCESKQELISFLRSQNVVADSEPDTAIYAQVCLVLVAVVKHYLLIWRVLN